MVHWSMTEYYVFLDKMVSEHKYTKSDVDSLIPFERDVLISLINERIEKRNHNVEHQIEAPTD